MMFMSNRFILFCLLLSNTLAWSKETQYEKLPLLLKDGTKITANLKTLIVHPKKKKRPVILVFGGFQDAARVLELIDLKRDVMLASFDYPFTPPKEPFQFPKSLKYLPQAKATIWNTLEGIELLINKLKKKSEVNPEKINILGASFGAPFAVYAAAKSQDLKGLIIIHGFGKIKEVIQHQAEKKLTLKFGSFAKVLSSAAAQTSWRYVGLPEIESKAKTLTNTQKVLMIQAENDERIPKHIQLSLKSAIQSSNAKLKYETISGGHLAPNQPKKIKKLLNKVTQWMDQNNLL